MTAIEKLIIAAIIAILVGIAFQPYYEAKAFNKMTGKNATYFDALFTELRVMAEPK